MRASSLALVLAGLFAAVGSTGAQNVPTRTLPKAEAEFAEPFSDVKAVRELRNGRVIVTDGRDLTVQLIDFRTGQATAIGRTGSGPGEYRWPGNLYALPGDSTLLHDQAGGRLLLITPDGKPGGLYDPNRTDTDSSMAARTRRFYPRYSDARGYLYSEGQPVRQGANGQLELADSAPIVRLDRATGKRDTVVMRPVRRDPTARVLPMGAVVSQPVQRAYPAWDHWLVAWDGRIAMVFHDPYHVDFVGMDGRVTRGAPILYEKVKVDDALKKQWMEELRRPRMAMMVTRGGGGSMQMMPPPPNLPEPEWPDVLPPYQGTATFASDGHLWIPRAMPAGAPSSFDVINGDGGLVERVTLPPRTKLIGFGNGTVYVVRLDEDDLQYLQRVRLTGPRQ